MSGVNHPDIKPEIQSAISFEQDFAERALELLGCYGISCVAVNGDYEIEFPVTDRIDVETEDDSELALRLVRRQVLAIAPAEQSSSSMPGRLTLFKAPVDRYIVLELQVGTIADEVTEEEQLVDEDFEWRPYINMIVDIRDPNHPDIVDAANGRPLDLDDLLKAKDALDLLGSELRGVGFATACELDDELSIEHRSLVTSYEKEFVPEEQDMNHECQHCGARNTVCSHDIVIQN